MALAAFKNVQPLDTLALRKGCGYKSNCGERGSSGDFHRLTPSQTNKEAICADGAQSFSLRSFTMRTRLMAVAGSAGIGFSPFLGRVCLAGVRDAQGGGPSLYSVSAAR